MLLVDTSVWVDHLAVGDDVLAARLDAGVVLAHPFVVGEVGLGSLAGREQVLDLLDALPCATPAAGDEARTLLERRQLWGRGVGWVDLHLCAATLLTPGARLWTRDRRLRAVADDLEIAADER